MSKGSTCGDLRVVASTVSSSKTSHSSTTPKPVAAGAVVTAAILRWAEPVLIPRVQVSAQVVEQASIRWAQALAPVEAAATMVLLVPGILMEARAVIQVLSEVPIRIS